MSNERPSPPATPTAFTVRDLFRWADVRDFAANALNPHWDARANGIGLTFESPVPRPDDPLPNGFRSSCQ